MDDKNNFWKRVRNIRRLSRKRCVVASSKPTPHEFANFYNNLFSHTDRSSNSHHKQIEEAVIDYASSISGIEYNNYFKQEEIEEAILKLKINKAAGIDFISNEFFLYGLCDNLKEILTRFYNVTVTTGALPDDFNTSLLIPIPKKTNISIFF